MPFIQHTVDTVQFYTSDALGGPAHGFSTRVGGVSEPPCDTLNLGSSAHDRKSDILENYSRFTGALGVSPDSLVFTKQVHSDDVRVASEEHRGNGYAYPSVWECDALISNTRGLTLTVFWADCVPVLLYDPVTGAAGAVHAGWRGTALGIAAKAAGMMAGHFGCRLEDIRAAVGPSIGPCCFETDDDVPEAIQASKHGHDARRFITRSGPKYRVDLKKINAGQLESIGLSHIDVSNLCTCCMTGSFFSHRRMGAARGTHAAMITV